jgi:hypothetical protein
VEGDGFTELYIIPITQFQALPGQNKISAMMAAPYGVFGPVAKGLINVPADVDIYLFPVCGEKIGKRGSANVAFGTQKRLNLQCQ